MRVLATASRAVAKKHDNPSCDRTRPFGHPPAGGYVFAGSVPPGHWPKPRRARRFGMGGAILLAAESGEARDAADKGRHLFYLHGGPSDRKGRLRPTRGGFRMLDRDLTALLRAINDAHAAGDPLELVEVIDIAQATTPDPEDRANLRKHRRKRARRKKEREEAGEADAAKKGALRLAATTRPTFAALPAITLAAKLLGSRSTDPRRPVSRRDVMALALLVTTVAGCRDAPSNCQPVACDPADASCPPSGRMCNPRRYGGGTLGTYDDSGGDG